MDAERNKGKRKECKSIKEGFVVKIMDIRKE